nr:probable LRR receptor-like serine/threonine-protein kinase At1g06840 [Coffea arabica]
MASLWDYTPNNLSNNLTTIVLSDNQLNGSIPESFSYLPLLQKLSLDNNFFTGSVTVDLWQNRSFSSAARLLIDVQNNSLSNIIGDLDPPVNVMLRYALSGHLEAVQLSHFTARTLFV